MKCVKIETAQPYDVLIGRGILPTLGEEVKKRVARCKAAIVTDSNVAPLYEKKIEESLRAAGFETVSFVFPAGESSKCLQTLGQLLEFLAEEGVTRQDIIVALGGGVVGDLAGFGAAIYQRGIPFVQVPTTFLAAVDSSVGGKTAIDLAAGKNMAGAFYQPKLVLCDVDTLQTLDADTFADGTAEVLKYGVIGNRELFDLVATGHFQDQLEDVIETCVKMKRDIVLEDERDTGARQVLNLGHTLGHAIEKKSGYTISHGHAVAAGLALIGRIAEQQGIAKEALFAPICQGLKANGLPCATQYSAKELAEGACFDKKRKGNEILFVFPERIGTCILKKVPLDAVENMVRPALEKDGTA